MAYNCEIKGFAPLPRGPLPTHEEMMAAIYRGRRAQSDACWNMLKRIFTFGLSRAEAKDAVVPAPLLWSMLDRLGYDASRLKGDAFKTKIAAMTRNCVACTHVETCKRWFDNMGPIDAYREFCPNAPAIGSLPRA